MTEDTTKERRRRAEDRIQDMLEERLQQVEQSLKRHVEYCMAQQQRVFWGLISVLGGIGWLVLKTLPIFASVAK